MNVPGTHPLAELLARKLFGIEGVPRNEQTKMVRQAIRAAVDWHETVIKRKDEAVKEAIGIYEEICQSRKGSIGAMKNVYLPQLGKGDIEMALKRARDALSKE